MAAKIPRPALSFSGSARMHVRIHDGPGAIYGAPRIFSASRLALPHTPQALVVQKWRSSACQVGQHAAAQVHLDDVVALVLVEVRVRAVRDRDDLLAAAGRCLLRRGTPPRSSKSAPGVRMVIATVRWRGSWPRQVKTGTGPDALGEPRRQSDLRAAPRSRPGPAGARPLSPTTQTRALLSLSGRRPISK